MLGPGHDRLITSEIDFFNGKKLGPFFLIGIELLGFPRAHLFNSIEFLMLSNVILPKVLKVKGIDQQGGPPIISLLIGNDHPPHQPNRLIPTKLMVPSTS